MGPGRSLRRENPAEAKLTALAKVLAALETAVAAVLARAAIDAHALGGQAQGVANGFVTNVQPLADTGGMLLGAAAAAHVFGACVLIKRSPYARDVQTVLAIAWLLVFPVGTIVGTIWLIACLTTHRPSAFKIASALVVAGALLAILTVVTVRIQRATIAGNERSAISVLHAIWIAQTNYHRKLATGRYALSIDALEAPCGGHAPLIAPSLVAGLAKFSGYRVNIDVPEGVNQSTDCAGRAAATEFTILAVPIESGRNGNRSFKVSTTGIVYERRRLSEPWVLSKDEAATWLGR